MTSDYGSKWNVACYIRLSKEDEKGKGHGGESESITNQRALLQSYIKENGLVLRKEYVDDGVSGTTFDRPSFKEMIRDIEHGLINMVITKDMSRLGRDYIEVGEYMEKYFPTKKVRYISLLDNIDTFLENSNNDIAPFKAIINDMYSKDISKKIRSTLRNKKEQGMFLGKVAPYGYQKSPEDKHKLVVDPVAKSVVEDIFEMYLNGVGVCQIADTLSNRGVPIPSIHNNINVGHQAAQYGLWNNRGITRILRSETYTGVLVQGKYKKLNYKSSKCLETDKQSWIKTPNSHEAIISMDDFEKVQRLLDAKSKLKPSKNYYLLAGLLRCYDCGSFISLSNKDKRYGWVYGRCGRYVKFHKHGLCTTHSFNYDKLENRVLDLLRELCNKHIDTKKIADVYSVTQRNKNDTEARVKQCEKELSKLNKKADLLYEDRLNGIISIEDYVRMSSRCNDEREQILSRIGSLKSLLVDDDNNKGCDKIIEDFVALKKPDPATLTQLIDRIEVHEKGIFDIYFRFPALQSLMDVGLQEKQEVG